MTFPIILLPRGLDVPKQNRYCHLGYFVSVRHYRLNQSLFRYPLFNSAQDFRVYTDPPTDFVMSDLAITAGTLIG